MNRVTTDNGWSIFGEPLHGRACRSCQFCCTHVPVEEPLNKLAGERCKHQCSKGCAIYANRPDPCKAWSCVWLFHEDAAAMKRPDISGYAIDLMPQTILIDDEPVDAIQVWVDAARPDSHRDPALRDFLAKAAKKYRLPAIVRWSDGLAQAGREAMVLVAPLLNDTNGWIENRSPMLSTEDMRKKLGEYRR